VPGAGAIPDAGVTLIAGDGRSRNNRGMGYFTRFAAAGKRGGPGVLALALVAVLPLAAGCDALAKAGQGSHNPPATSFTVAGRVTRVVVDGGTGSIAVTGSARSTVSVAQQSSYTSKPPAATHVLRDGTLTMSYHCPAELACGVSYQVQVPRGVPVSVSVGAGSVTLTSLAGPVTARASAGMINAVDLRSPAASFTSNAGSIAATFAVAPRSLSASTNVGPVTLTVPGSAAYKVDTHTVVGSSTVTVRRSDSSGHSITARSDLGSVTISPR
jgi:hypothetical protein